MLLLLRLLKVLLLFEIMWVSYPPEVWRTISVWRLLDQLVDALEVVGHRLALVDVRHLARLTNNCENKFN